jgi:FdhD protein
MEEPFEIRINGRSLATIMRTPGSGGETDRELAIGFLLTEGIISQPEQVSAILRVKDQDGLPEENVLNIKLKESAGNPFGEASETDNGRFERRFMVASSCGICGKTSIQAVCRHLPPLNPIEPGIDIEVLYSLPQTLRSQQAIFDKTGGLHAAGIFDFSGNLQILREDIGRHNAVDKAIGRMALDRRYPLSDRILLVSGRISFEIIQKALAARIPIIAAVSAPSSLALELAQESGITVAGFLRGNRCNIYTHPERIIS